MRYPQAHAQGLHLCCKRPSGDMTTTALEPDKSVMHAASREGDSSMPLSVGFHSCEPLPLVPSDMHDILRCSIHGRSTNKAGLPSHGSSHGSFPDARGVAYPQRWCRSLTMA